MKGDNTGMFTDDLIQALRDGRWEVDCANVVLTQNDAIEPTVFSGPGYLRQNEEGVVEFKIYAGSDHPWNIWEKQLAGIEGKLIESNQYYTIKATDRFDRCWEWWRTVPEIGSSGLEAGIHHFVEGKAFELKSTRNSPHALNKFGLVMYIFADIEIPCNERTNLVKSVAGEKQHSSSHLNVAKFVTSVGEFCISNQNGLVVIKVSSEVAFPKHLEVRIVESLGFVLAKPLSWSAIERYENGVETLRIRGQKVDSKARLGPPVGGGTIDRRDQIWRLFDKYLTFVCGNTADHFHLISRHIFSTLEASAGTINAQGLALGVAVEGIVNKLFPKAGALAPALKPRVKQLRHYFDKWEALKDAETHAALSKRIHDMLNRMLDVSAKSKLYALAKEHVVHGDHVKAWSELRNASAHGETPGSQNLQTLVDLCHKATVLMYHLVFRVIGFEGVYVDYATPGWPSKHYRGRPVTHGDIATAAYFMWKRESEKHGYDVEHWLKSKDTLENCLI